MRLITSGLIAFGLPDTIMVQIRQAQMRLEELDEQVRGHISPPRVDAPPS